MSLYITWGPHYPSLIPVPTSTFQAQLLCQCPFTDLLVPSEESPDLSLALTDLQDLSCPGCLPVPYQTPRDSANNLALSQHLIPKTALGDHCKGCSSVQCWGSSVTCTGLDVPCGLARTHKEGTGMGPLGAGRRGEPGE